MDPWSKTSKSNSTKRKNSWWLEVSKGFERSEFSEISFRSRSLQLKKRSPRMKMAKTDLPSIISNRWNQFHSSRSQMKDSSLTMTSQLQRWTQTRLRKKNHQLLKSSSQPRKSDTAQMTQTNSRSCQSKHKSSPTHPRSCQSKHKSSPTHPQWLCTYVTFQAVEGCLSKRCCLMAITTGDTKMKSWRSSWSLKRSPKSEKMAISDNQKK